jgi:hypothetical protein
MDKKVQIRIWNELTNSAEVHSFDELHNARDFLTDRIREEKKNAKVEKVNDVPGE